MILGVCWMLRLDAQFFSEMFQRHENID